MSVYKEGYAIVEKLENHWNKVQIFRSSGRIGIPTTKGDETWNMVKQLYDWYGDDSRVETRWGCSFTATLVDEWAVSDERKTWEQATEKWKVTYKKLEPFRTDSDCNPGLRSGSRDGWFEITRI